MRSDYPPRTAASVARHYAPPVPAVASVAPSQAPQTQLQDAAAPDPSRPRTSAPPAPQGFALPLLISDPLVWLGNTQRALLVLAIVSSTTVLALLCLGGFLDHLTGP